MKVLITGAGGFLGGVLAKELQRYEGTEVVGLSRSPVPVERIGSGRQLSRDLRRELFLDESVDYIIHCAAIQNFEAMSIKDFIDANLEMTRNVAEYGKRVGVKGLFFTSSLDLYGEIRTDTVHERTDVINPAPYGMSKQLCELLLKEYQEFFPVVALRLCGVVGPGATDGWLARMLSKAKRGEDLVIVNADRQFNNILHTDDICNFIQLLMKNRFAGFSAFPLASQGSLSIRAVVAGIIKDTGSKSAIIDNGVTRNSFVISNEFAINQFGYLPSDVRTNLKKFVRENATN